ncbi:hypothetical protein OG21DRAFT_1511299 [Imleria badia]|nr:hypothetical protein OG21DRAFT_1511299 [Imleria badia]
MGSTLQLFNIHHFLTVLFHRFMSQRPTYIPGLFGSEYRVPTRAWHEILRDDASSCYLMRLEFYKTKGETLHEFLVLHFSHPTHTVARAVAVVDRAVKDRSQSSVIFSPSAPSQNTTEAIDRLHVMGQGENLETYLSRTYGKYDKLCTLRYPSAEFDLSSPTLGPPSAIQVSTLLLVATNHQPNYNLYEYNCYWYADTIFEACKKLFPACQEDCYKHRDRGRCRLNIPMLAKHNLPDICAEYHNEWNKVVQRRQENQEIMTQQEWERRFEAAKQEWEQKHEAARQEWERRLEEAERRCEQLQAVRQPPRHLGHPAI